MPMRTVHPATRNGSASRDRRPRRPLASCRRRAIVSVLAACILIAVVTFSSSVGRSKIFGPRERVLVIGAGAAGLAAASSLASYASVLVLEAQERLGGRVHTNRSLGVPVELGSVWIHRAEGNVVTELAQRHGCSMFTSENKRVVVYDEAGGAMRAATVTKVYSAFSRQLMPDVLKRRRALRADGRDDVSLGTLLAQSVRAHVEDFGSPVRRCVLDFLLFRDIVQDHTADLWQTSAARYDTDHCACCLRASLACTTQTAQQHPLRHCCRRCARLARVRMRTPPTTATKTSTLNRQPTSHCSLLPLSLSNSLSTTLLGWFAARSLRRRLR